MLRIVVKEGDSVVECNTKQAEGYSRARIFIFECCRIRSSPVIDDFVVVVDEVVLWVEKVGDR